jgi:hypothetical protein
VHHAGVRWCIINCESVPMAAAKRKSQESKAGSSPRTSVTFPPELYRTLEDLAKKKKVSVAWVVREAAEKYVADQWPLFSHETRGRQ